MKTINLRLDGDAEAALTRLAAASSGLSQNALINKVLVDFAAIEGGACEQRSWRRGEASGFRQLADWCKIRADHFVQHGSAVEKRAIQELRWAAKQFGTMARQAAADAERLEVGPLRFDR